MSDHSAYTWAEWCSRFPEYEYPIGQILIALYAGVNAVGEEREMFSAALANLRVGTRSP